MKKILAVLVVSLFVAGNVANAGSGCDSPRKYLIKLLSQ